MTDENYFVSIPIGGFTSEYKLTKLPYDGDLKQVIIVNTKLGMRKGKIASQVAHAAVIAAYKVPYAIYKEWTINGHKKVVLNGDIDIILNAVLKAESGDIPHSLIVDQGLTQIEPNSVTACAIGPWYSDKIDLITGDLKLLN